MTKNRNRFIYLLEVYELLLEEPQTFNSLRTSINMGYQSLRRLLDRMIEKELTFIKQRDGIDYYYPTQELFELFADSFYDGLQQLRRL